MQLWKAFVVVLCLACLVGAVSAAARPGAERGLCGTSTIKGHRWLIVTKKFSCAAAKTVTGRLANVRIPKNRALCNGSAGSPCRRKGMACTTTSRPGTKPKWIACFANKSHTAGFSATRL
jgi:hypothetical protein